MDGSSLETVLLKLAIVCLLILANGFFVGAEFALVGVRRARVASLAAEGNRRARTLMRVLDDLQAYISATQLGITLASLAIGWIGEQTVAGFLEPVFQRLLPGPASEIASHTIAAALAFALITFLVILLGELVPKTLALDRTLALALAVARPLELFYRTFKAPIWLLNRSGELVVRLMGLKSTAENTAAYSEEELRHVIALSHKSGHLIEDERRFISNIFDFTVSTVESVMVPRTEVEALDAELSPVQMLEVFEQTGYSRMPVYRESLDNIIGILLQKDLSRMLRAGGEFKLNEVLRQPVFLPTSVKLNDALRRLRRSSEHMAMVVDEHGGVEGLVTLEDLIEEIVGDIRDEHDDTAMRQIVEQPDGTYRVTGMLSIRDANRRLELGLPESDSYHTIAGFMMARAGRLMRPGESVDYSGLRLTVASTARNRIVEATIERMKDESARRARSAEVVDTSAKHH
ncbi:MAG TPA: hemolysin family protein [Blastocatellia bacterium]|nr:hemolysin family protein [Blastocatellia bacterium]